MPDRAAIVTGASSGVGLAIAQVLAEAGHGLTLSARRPDKLETAALALKRYQVETVAGNLADEADVKRLVESHEARFGRLDVLVNAANVAAGDVDTRLIDAQLDVNLRAPILLYRECAEMLRGGLVVNVAAAGGLAVHEATAAGLVAFTHALGRDGIRSVTLTPDRDALHTRDVAEAVRALL
jgi:NAD(P)-dependent dehydrogenase (short-subunit alcohol dehydrogenase family)